MSCVSCGRFDGSRRRTGQFDEVLCTPCWLMPLMAFYRKGYVCLPANLKP